MKKKLGLALLVGLVLLISIIYFEQKQKSLLRINFLDVGQGDATLIQGEQGQNILIDGGPDKSVLQGLSQRLPWWDKTLDVVILTHSHDDHLVGLLEVAKRFKVKKFYYPYNTVKTDLLQAFIKQVQAKNGEVISLDRDYTLNFGAEELQLLVATSTMTGVADPENEQSMIEKLIMPKGNILLMADAGLEREKRLIKNQVNLQAQLIKIGHHGSDYATGLDFIKAVRPQQAVISVGKGNKFGHPSLRVVKKLLRNQVRVSRTDVDGAVAFKYTGQGWQLD